MIPITARFQSKILIMIFGTLGCSALIFQTVFSGNPEYAWTSHVAAPIIGGSFSGMMGLGTWLPRPDIGRAWTWAEHGLKVREPTVRASILRDKLWK